MIVSYPLNGTWIYEAIVFVLPHRRIKDEKPEGDSTYWPYVTDIARNTFNIPSSVKAIVIAPMGE